MSQVPEYLVRMRISLPPDTAPRRRAELLDAERTRGLALISEGSIERIWRIPGQQSNVGIWRADSASQLHDKIASLPLFRWMAVDVTALATHPLEVPNDES